PVFDSCIAPFKYVVIVKEFNKSTCNKSLVSLIIKPASVPAGNVVNTFSTAIDAVLATPATTFIIAKSVVLSLMTLVALSTSQATHSTPLTPLWALFIITGCSGLFNIVGKSQSSSPSAKASNTKPYTRVRPKFTDKG